MMFNTIWLWYVQVYTVQFTDRYVQQVYINSSDLQDMQGIGSNEFCTD